MSHAEVEAGASPEKTFVAEMREILGGEGLVPTESFGCIMCESAHVWPGCGWPHFIPVADFALVPIHLPGQSSHASLRVAAGEVDREVPVISLKEVNWREVRLLTGPEAGALGPIHVILLPAAFLLPSCCSPF